MVKEKKISITHYLNKNVKTDKSDYGYFPVYTRIVFNRQSTHVNILDFRSEGITEKHFAEIFEQKISKKELAKIQGTEKLIESVIRHEYKILGDDYKIKGIAKRIFKYAQSVTILLNNDMCDKLKIFTEDYLTVTNHRKAFDNSVVFFTTQFGRYYDSLANNHLKSIRKELDPTFAKEITAYVNLLHYESHFSKEIYSKYSRSRTKSYVLLMDWITGEEKKPFEKFLHDKVAGKKFNNKYTGVQKEYLDLLLSDFKPIKKDISSYVKFIEELVIPKD